MIIPYYVVFVWGSLVTHSTHAYDTEAECDAFALEYTASHAGSGL